MPIRAAPACVLFALGVACTDEDPATGPSCSEPDASAVVSVAGNYRYFGHLRGTIQLEQSGSTVSIVKTTYENANDRPVIGSGELAGNVLDAVLVPENGDTDYRADVRFVFTSDGGEFCVAFSDTNGDRGPLGSYTGRREP